MATDPSKTGTTLLNWLHNPANSEAWGKFAERYQQRILECCLNNGLQQADGQEIAQNLLLRIRYAIVGFDLQVMRWEDGTGVPPEGNNLVIVGTDVNDRLHVRIFNWEGKRVKDRDETKLDPAQAQAILALKRQLPNLLPPRVMSDGEKVRVLREIATISGKAQITKKFEYNPSKGKFRNWLTRVTRNACRDLVRGRVKGPQPLPPEIIELIGKKLKEALVDQARTEVLHIALEQVRTQVSPTDYAIFRRRVFDRIAAATVAQQQVMSVAAVDRPGTE